jgi:hypothetical protein
MRPGAWQFSSNQAGQADISNQLIRKGQKKPFKQKSLFMKFDVKYRPMVISS